MHLEMLVKIPPLAMAALVAALCLLTPVSSAQAAPALTPSLGGYVNAGSSAEFAFSLSDVNWQSAIVRISLAEGTMSVDTTGLALTLQPGSASFSNVTEIEFTGSLADVTTALADRLSWTAPATEAVRRDKLDKTLQAALEKLRRSAKIRYDAPFQPPAKSSSPAKTAPAPAP